MNKNFEGSGSTNSSAACDVCGALSLRQIETTQHFPYVKEGEEVQLTATVPAWQCSSCGFEFTDGDAEEIRHEAVCRYLHVLSPREIREIRAIYQMTQSEFAEETGFGEASIKRWELGLNIQNKSADKYLRLLRDKRLSQSAEKHRPQADPIKDPKRRPKFRTVLPAKAFLEASVFELRLQPA